MRRLAGIETRHSTVMAIVGGGVVAGTLDIGAAALINMASPALILRFVAGGLLGGAALEGGASIALLGYLLQLAMSLIIATIYVGASRQLAFLRTRWIAAGLAFGVVVFFVMNYVVLPLSAWARVPHFTVASFCWNVLAMLAFGVVIAWFARAVSRAQ
jgi:hypothetical protein